MTDKDIITKEYMQDNEIFADAFNFFIYNGRQVIRPEKLRELDTTAIALPYGEDDQPVPVQKERDVLKTAVAMEDDNAAYLLLGVENQSQIHYAMAVRNMLYDAIQYTNQVMKAEKSHRAAGNYGDSKAEFLSGFYKTDRLLPVITLVIHFGAEKWDAPKSIYEMLNVQDKEILKYIADYRINLISPEELSDNEFGKFHTELSSVMKYIKYSKDKEKLKDIVNSNEFRDVNRDTANVIKVITNTNFKIEDGKERINMCKAIEDMINESRAEGMAKGRAEGMAKGRAEGRAEERNNLAANLREMGMTEEQIKQALKQRN